MNATDAYCFSNDFETATTYQPDDTFHYYKKQNAAFVFNICQMTNIS